MPAKKAPRANWTDLIDSDPPPPASEHASNGASQQASKQESTQPVLRAKSYRLPPALAKEFARWALDNDTTEQQALALAMREFLDRRRA